MKKIEKVAKTLEKIGEIDEIGICPFCNNTTLFRFDKFDAYCCVVCNVWIEEKCLDPTCEYCSSRPLLPTDAVKAELIDIQKAWQELRTIFSE